MAFHAPDVSDFGSAAPIYELYWQTVGTGVATAVVALVVIVALVRRRGRAGCDSLQRGDRLR